MRISYLKNVENSNTKGFFFFFFYIPYHIVQLNAEVRVNSVISKQEPFTYANPPAASVIEAQETLFKNTADAISTGAFKVMPFKIPGKNKTYRDYQGNSYLAILAENK